MRVLTSVVVWLALSMQPVSVMAQANITEQRLGNYIARWQWFTSAEGRKSAIDLNSIVHPYYAGGAADAVVYFDRGSPNWMQDSHRYRFDCKGTVRDIDLNSAIPIPHGSVVEIMENVACAMR